MGKVIPISTHPNYHCHNNVQNNSAIFYLDDNNGLDYYGYSKPGYYFWNKEYNEVYGWFKTMSIALNALDAYLDSDML
jgi:hypothetical protein